LKCVIAEPLEPGPRLPFSVVPRQKLNVTDVMRILRHDKESEPDPSARTSPFICALCSGGTQTSFVAQLRKIAPADIGLVYWVCLSSPRTSFYVPFHLGVTDFPAGWRLESERPTGETYTRRVQAPFTANSQEAFWVYSNFREKADDAGPAMIARVKAEAERLEREAIVMQPAIEEAAHKLYKKDKASAIRLLENYSKGIYLSSLEAMSTLCAGR
jgi:dipeptidase